MPNARMPSRRRTGCQTTPATGIASSSSTRTTSYPLTAKPLRPDVSGRQRRRTCEQSPHVLNAAPTSGASSRPQLLEHDRVDLVDSVDPLLEVLGPGPACEGGRELAVVAEPSEPLTQLAGERVVDGHPLGARRAAEEGEVEAVEPRQLDDRLGVVVDAEVDEDV